MRTMRILLAGLVVLCWFGSIQTASAGILGDAKKWYDDRQAFNAHATNVANAVREVYRERTTLTSFTNSALGLIQNYKAAKAAGSINLSQLINMAPQLLSLADGYQKLQPKVQSVYNRITPDIAYFNQFRGTENQGTEVPTLSEAKIGGMARTAGVARIWSAIKDKPTNIFRWGRLADEYRYGRDTTAYGLKGVQIAMEFYNAYATSQSAFQELLGIKNEIQQMTQGNLGALLNVGGTLQKINSADGSIKKIENLLNTAPKHFDQRFTELGQYQTNYLNTFKAYSQKYGDPEGRRLASSPVPGASSPLPGQSGNTGATAPSGTVSTSSGNSDSSAWRTPPIVGDGTITISLPDAMKKYQDLYKDYMKLITDPSATDKQRRDSAKQLQDAYKTLQQLKSQVR